MKILEKKCVICGKLYPKRYDMSLKNWEKSKYCSLPCMWESKKGNTYKKGKTGYKAWNAGKKLHYKVWNKGKGAYAKKLGFGKWMKGRHLESYKLWKGEKVGYVALHEWINRWKGKPEKCEHCGRDGLKGRMIHWANKSHKYKRELDDWIRLCAKCHKKYDKR